MAGHSKWANIKHRKNAQDAKRGKMFTKLIREITVSAKMGGADAGSNPRLRTAIDKALDQNMTRDTIDRAIKRGVGGTDDQDMQDIRYEGYGPMGVAIMVDCLTDNRNRTVSDVRHAFTKMGGNLGTNGSVAFNFNHLGQLYFNAEQDETLLLETAIEAGAEDVIEQEDGSFIVNTSPEQFNAVLEYMVKKGLKPEQSELTMVPNLMVTLDLENAQIFMKLVDMLEDLDDVQNVYSNAEIPDAIGKQL